MTQICQIIPSRAYLSYHYLTKFDCVDNQIWSYNSRQFNFLNLTDVFIQTKLNWTSSKDELLKIIILLEILTQQRVFIKSSSQINFLKCYDLKITIQKRKLAIFLDLCLPIIFLTSVRSSAILIINSVNINQKVHIFSSTKLAEKFISNINYSIEILNYLNQEKKVNFLPNL